MLKPTALRGSSKIRGFDDRVGFAGFACWERDDFGGSEEMIMMFACPSVARTEVVNDEIVPLCPRNKANLLCASFARNGVDCEVASDIASQFWVE